MEPLPLQAVSTQKDAPVAQHTCNGSRLLLARSGDAVNSPVVSLFLTRVSPWKVRILLVPLGFMQFSNHPPPKGEAQ